MALVRVYCGLVSAYPPRQLAVGSSSLYVTIVDDAGRLLDVCEIGDDSYGYAYLSSLLAERATGPYSVAIATNGGRRLVPRLLATAGWALAVVDDEATDDFAERFADELQDNGNSAPTQRRALGLARALQGGALSAALQPAAAELADLKPMLATLGALATGRHASSMALREVLRELYPAALRAYPDPADPVALAVLDALPEPGTLASSSSGRSRDAAVAADAVAGRLAAAGLADQSAITEAITALRVAIAETPRRGGIGRAFTATIAETVRQSVAAVRAYDMASTAVVKALADRVAPARHAAPVSAVPAPAAAGHTPASNGAAAAPQRPTAIPRAARVPAATSAGTAGSPAGAAASAGPSPQETLPQETLLPPPRQPMASPPPSRLPVRSASPAPQPIASAPPAHQPIASAPPAHQPIASAPPAHQPIASAPPARQPITSAPPARQPITSAPPVRQPVSSAPPARQQPFAPAPPARQPIASAPPAPRPVTAPPAATRPTSPPPIAPAHMSPPAHMPPPARRAAPANRPVSPPPPPPPGITPIGDPRAPLPNRTPARGSDQIRVPVTRPTLEGPPPGSRADWPTRPPADDWAAPPLPSRANREPSPNGSSPSNPVTPPWRSNDLRPPEPPTLRLVEPTLPPELRDELGISPTMPEPSRTDSFRSSDSSALTGPFRSDPFPADSSRSADPLRTDLPRREPARFEQRPLRLVEAGRNGVPRSAPPVSADDDDSLLIFAATRSAWFDKDDQANWNSAMDIGWQAAEQAAHPTVGDRTEAGLPRRVPHANLVPGAPPRRDDRPLRVVRDPARIAEHTNGYFSGWRRGQEVGGYPLGGRQRQPSAGAWEFHRDEDRLSG